MADANEPEKSVVPENQGAGETGDGRLQRQSVAGGLFDSVKHLQEAHATGFSSLRKTDKVSQILLLLAIVAVAAAQVMPAQQFAVMLVADGLLAVALLAFLALRFGVLRTLQSRQAILVWQLILGSFLLGLFLAFNLKMFVLFESGISIGR